MGEMKKENVAMTISHKTKIASAFFIALKLKLT